jgi:hypothetical protein
MDIWFFRQKLYLYDMKKITFFNPDELDRNLKVTIHKTGKMGFTMDAAKKLSLAEMKSANIGINNEDPEDDCLYLVIYKDVMEGRFRISKAGSYYYINTKILFDNLKLDYSKGNVSYDMTEERNESEIMYKLKKRNARVRVAE